MGGSRSPPILLVSRFSPHSSLTTALHYSFCLHSDFLVSLACALTYTIAPAHHKHACTFFLTRFCAFSRAITLCDSVFVILRAPSRRVFHVHRRRRCSIPAHTDPYPDLSRNHIHFANLASSVSAALFLLAMPAHSRPASCVLRPERLDAPGPGAAAGDTACHPRTPTAWLL
ncbi:hypothetical protein P154DRAFT_179948 [Amniculicola lignicola CBS 123094]|uniref:Uncharacterized protein n=1 Tax=Amniculicola lignicola CBS 123094 TaxID=1392246 RepID=A0A6A5WYP8_9PLEO|nr:hypothetical protein P154DRAFT_179948 [Amniculicola lignicola CBS 123094]